MICRPIKWKRYTGSEVINFVSNVIGWGSAMIDDPDYPGPTLIGVAGNNSAKVIKYNLGVAR